ncbi:hypothetical protein WN943_029356 [Citrus x changshan-huyou]|uniref:Uncharacterized protein n=2 Tax=Citrus sinensis TaxID=2711 RepID=A0ACB8I2Y0_CITSI|nr:hypothetical protein KPL71_026935 [Citrus sinensis]KDO38341.1 hypothetical protein CISIN_1g037410mg [Citrus sinensis]
MEEILELCPSLLLNVNAKGDTPLRVAAKFGHSDIVSVLVQTAKIAQHGDGEPESGIGADRQMIRMANNEKNTALHEAVCHGNVHVVKILTKQGPDNPYSANNYGKTPLYMAAKGRYSEMVIELLETAHQCPMKAPTERQLCMLQQCTFILLSLTRYSGIPI